ncbi:MAG: ATP-binding protein [Pseudomonadota bacterium]
MKLSFINLRTGILSILSFLLFSGMLLLGLVALKMTENGILAYQKELGFSIIGRLQRYINNPSTVITQDISEEQLRKNLAKEVASIFIPRLFEQIEVIGKNGKLLVSHGNALSTIDVDWIPGLPPKKKEFTIQKNTMRVSAPLFKSGNIIAVAYVSMRIESVHNILSKLKVSILLYVGLNIAVIVLLGNFLLSRMIIRPIGNLVRLADHFKDDNLFQAEDSNPNELNKLAVALSRMLKKLSENKALLESQIESMKMTNSKLQEAHEEVVRSERLASVGRLAAGVAHEIGNPISAILGYINILIEEVEEREPARDYLKRVEDEVMRIDAIVRELLDFARPSHSECFKIDLNHVVHDTVSFFSYQGIAKQIEIICELAPEPLIVWVDSNKLRQVILNLMLNAYDAILERKDKLAGEKAGWRPLINIKTERVAEETIMSISDTGTGISQVDMEKLFDPFYTTKPPGKGTGLGLAISLRIIESFNGTIRIKSHVGEGTTIMVTLPANNYSGV